jgi:hypothetical protein
VPGIVALFYISFLDEAGSCELALPPLQIETDIIGPAAGRFLEPWFVD